MNEKNSRVAMITGASSGVGEAVALRFAKEGYSVAIGARRDDRLQDLSAKIESECGGTVLAQELDIRSAQSSSDFVANALSKFGQIDVLVNCAGVALGREPADSANLADWAQMIETNYSGPAQLIKEIIPPMKEKGAGQIINIGALAALFPHPGSVVYASAKEAIRMFLKCLREDTLGTGIRVSNIDPGIIRTEFAHVRFRGNDDAVSTMLKGMRPLEPENVAECVWFIASLPPHVNVDQMTVLPTDQTSPTRVHRA